MIIRFLASVFRGLECMTVSLMCKAIVCIIFKVQITVTGNHQILMFQLRNKERFIEIIVSL